DATGHTQPRGVRRDHGQRHQGVGARGFGGPRRVVAARLRFLSERDHLAAGECGEGENDAELAHGVVDSMGWAITSPEYTAAVLRCPGSVGSSLMIRSAGRARR